MPRPSPPPPSLAMRAQATIAQSTRCICRVYEASKHPPLPHHPSPIDAVSLCERIFPQTTLSDCPEGATRTITEHIDMRKTTDFSSHEWMLYRSMMKEVCVKGSYRKESTLVQGERTVSQDLADCSLYNILYYFDKDGPPRRAPVVAESLPELIGVCSACGKLRS